MQWDPAPLEQSTPIIPGLPGLGAVVAGYAVGVTLAFTLGWALSGDDADADLTAQALSSLGLWAGLLGACVYVSHRRGTTSLVRDFQLRFRWIDIGFGIAGSVAGRILAGFAISPIPLPTRRLRDVDRSTVSENIHGGWQWLVVFLIICVGAPLFEELFFRGLLQPRLVSRYGVAIGIGVSSLLFGAAHLIGWDGPFSFAYAWAIAVGGLVLGAIRHYTGRLGPAILAHTFFNAQALAAVALL